jgi:GNAT superfamily N-acetyltransferase
MDNHARTEVRELEPEQSHAARDLVLGILNHEFWMAFTLDELPDLIDIHQTYRDSGNGNFWVVADGKQMAGCIGVLRLASGHYELRRMYVDPPWRGRGIAQRLLETLFEWCARNGVAHLWLETNEAWHAAHHIYEKHGFTPVARDRLPPEFPVVRVATGFYHRTMTPRDNGLHLPVRLEAR